jgi:hypothetical protein
MSSLSRTIKTPHPSLRALRVFITEAQLASVGLVLPEAGTLLRDFPSQLRSSDYLKNCGDFRYLDQLQDGEDAYSNPGVWLSFAPSRTQAQRDEPFRTTTKFGNHYWHTILLDLEPITVDSTADSYVMRETYIPAATEGSRFVIQEFYSDIPFDIPKYPTPVASAVSYDVISRRGGFPECLHDRIVIPTVTSSNGTKIPKQVFPATNRVTWVSYIISDEQTLTEGGYYRKRVRVYPPALPEAVIRNR